MASAAGGGYGGGYGGGAGGAGGAGGGSGAYGSGGFVEYRNIKPRTRAERRQMQDKETLEKSRLRQRTGGYHKYVDYGKSITEQATNSCAFMAEADRFHTDTAGEEALMRQAQFSRREQLYVKKRNESAAREDARWAKIDADRRADEEKWSAIRDAGEKARRNQSSVPYNPLTLKYHESKEGNLLRHNDDMIRYRAAQRAVNLQVKNNGSDYNPITGDPARRMQSPPHPGKPPATGSGSARSSSRPY